MWPMRFVLPFAAFLLSSVLCAQPKLAKDLKRGAPDQTLNVIVRLRETPTQGHSDQLQALGASEHARFNATRAIALAIPAKSLDALAALPWVTYITPDRVVTPLLDTSRAATLADPVIYTGLSGEGIGVAVIDSGFSPSSDIPKNTVAYSEAFGFANTSDQFGHGTPVIGVIAGNGSQSGGRYRGLAPGARIVNLRALGPDGNGTDSSVIAAIERAIALKTRFNIHVLNLSLGRPVFESYKFDPLCQAVEAAWRAGIAVVAAAGNDGRNNAASTLGYGTIASPGNDPLAITVGALKTMGTTLRDDDVIASYSSKGPTAYDHIVKPDLIAPGNAVVVPTALGDQFLDKQYPQIKIGGSYVRLSGSSIAAAFVSGGIALLLERDPDLTPDQVKIRLMRSAWKGFAPETTVRVAGAEYSTRHDVFAVGAGALDLNAAVNDTAYPTGIAPSPVAVYDTGSDTVRLKFVCDPAWTAPLVWSSPSVGGPSFVWGANIVPGYNIVWGSNVVWGVSSLPGFKTIWGNTTVWDKAWGAPSAWGSSKIWGPSILIAGE